MLVLRAIYGCMESSLQWYKLYSGTLTEKGFKLNQYGICVTNKLANGKQCTLVWYVDDNKVSHMEENVVEDFIDVFLIVLED